LKDEVGSKDVQEIKQLGCFFVVHDDRLATYNFTCACAKPQFSTADSGLSGMRIRNTSRPPLQRRKPKAITALAAT
jgi:hypothetical protein